MVTDRVATTCLLAVLAVRYPAAHLPCLLLIMLDISRWVGAPPTAAARATPAAATQRCLPLPL